MSYSLRAINQYALLQVATALIASALVAIIWDAESALAFGFGTLVMLLPQLFFVYRIFVYPVLMTKAGKKRQAALHDPQLGFLTLMRAEGTKFVLVVVAFAVVFRMRPDLPAIAVFAGVVVMLLVTTIGNLIYADRFVQQIEPSGDDRKPGE